MGEEYLKKLIITRLRTIPPDVSFSVGDYGNFTRNELIEQVEKNTKIGQAVTKMELNFLQKLPKLSQMV